MKGEGMDERTEDQKLYDTALRSEKRTIGHRMSRKVLVIAPTYSEAQRWAHEHGIAYSDTVYVGPINADYVMNGMTGVEHVILGWARLDATLRMVIKDRLRAIESPPFEGEAVDELCTADPERV